MLVVPSPHSTLTDLDYSNDPDGLLRNRDAVKTHKKGRRPEPGERFLIKVLLRITQPS